MLKLDYLHRCRSPLDPQLRGRVRWVAAHANGSLYGQACAAGDLRRAGLPATAIRALAGDHADLPASTRAALAFARKLTVAAHTITDAEVAHLIETHGEKQVVALVLLVAYANFQDRLTLSLDLSPEADGLFSPVEVRFARAPLGASRAGPPHRPPAGTAAAPAVQRVADPEWLALDSSRLQLEIARQRVRRPRIRVPGDDPLAIQWGLVCQTYQPELAAAWSACTHAFGDEANQDRVFEETLFWVVTRTVGCFY
jgi:hypothetical protein